MQSLDDQEEAVAEVAASDPGYRELAQEEADLDLRLSRIEGQVRGIRRMVAEGRDCKELTTQFAAVAKALDRAAINYLTAHLVYCIENPEIARTEGTSIEELRRLLGRLL